MSGVRVDHRGVKVPPPSESLFSILAEVGYDQAVEGFAMSGHAQCIAWHKTTDEVRDIWSSVARAMYASLVAQAGGKVKVIPDG